MGVDVPETLLTQSLIYSPEKRDYFPPGAPFTNMD